MTNAFIHLFNKNLQITHSVPGTILDTAGAKVNQIQSLAPRVSLAFGKV